MGFGIPQYGNTENFYKNYRLKSPDLSKNETVFTLILRVMPPMHSLAEVGKWAIYYGQHFGYAGNGKEPGKVRQRPFGCIKKEDFRTKMVTVPCAACEAIDTHREERDAREAEYKAKGLPEKEARELLGPLTDWLKKHNCDRKWFLNVMDQQGNFGVLQISHTLKKVLDEKMRALREEDGIDPMLPDQGVWFKFTRMGKFPVQDNVEVLTESVKVEGVGTVKKTVLAPLTEAQCNEALKICPDLAKDVVKFITGPQIKALVASSGDPDEIDRIWQMGTKATSERSPAKFEVSEVERLKAELARLQAQSAAKSEAAAKAGVTEDTADVSVDEIPDEGELTDEQFYKKYGITPPTA